MISIKKIINKVKELYTPPSYIIKEIRTKEGVDGHLVSYLDKHSYLAEQYKVLRTNLYSLSPQTPLKTIIVTSSQAQEGKTITTSNLAYTLSLDAEKKVVLVDADFRRPAVHKAFGIPRKPGFTDILSGKNSLEHFTKKPTVDDLYIIPSGTLISSPSEFLSSTKMKELISKLKEKFDYVIFDTPPIINVTDSSILGSLCDGVIFVVKAGHTPKNMIEEAFTMLRHAQAKPKACILTSTTIPVYYYYLAKYRYYYKYRYGYRAAGKNTSPK